MVESLFSKVKGKVTAFCSYVENSIMFISIFPTVALLEILRNLLFKSGVAGLQSASCNTTKMNS